MVRQNNKRIITNFTLQLNGKKFQKRRKMHLPIIWIERISLLQVYLSQFIAKQGTIFEDTCFKQGTQFCPACSSGGLIYYGPANWLFRRHTVRELFSYYYLLWIFFCIFFSNQFFQKIAFFCVLVKENQEAFSERYSLVSGVLEGLVKICKKYMELNPFLLLSCSLEE